MLQEAILVSTNPSCSPSNEMKRQEKALRSSPYKENTDKEEEKKEENRERKEGSEEAGKERKEEKRKT